MNAMENQNKLSLSAILTATALTSFSVILANAGGWNLKGTSLSVDSQGWAFNGSLAAASDGTLYAAFDQHRDPGVFEAASPYAAKWNSSSWQTLGTIGLGNSGRIAHSNNQVSGAITITWAQQGMHGWMPSLVAVGTTPYVAYYETVSNALWGAPSSGITASVFVSHWNGTAWVYDFNPANSPNYAINTSSVNAGRDPSLAIVSGKPAAAWIETPRSSPYDYLVVKHLDSGGWTQDGSTLTITTSNQEKIINVALADLGGSPIVAWSRFHLDWTKSPVSDNSSTIQVARLVGGSWQALGGALNFSASNHVNQAAITVMSGVPYVAWQEKTDTGPYQIYVSHWNGSAWVNDGGSLNFDAANGDAGRPALANNGTTLYVTWAEGALNQPAQLYVRSLSAGIWSAPQGLNVNSSASADAPSLAIANGSAQVLWSEVDPTSNTKQVYVKGQDASAGSIASIAAFGANGPAISLVNNTWTALNPGGIIKGAPANSLLFRPYVTFLYDNGIHKAISWFNYHNSNGGQGWDPSEQQDGMIQYDFKTNRWDFLDFTNTAWSEFLPPTGQDEGMVTIGNNHVYITHGNLLANTATGDTARNTYGYDLPARRGRRLLPRAENMWVPNSVASAYDSDHNVTFMVGPQAIGTWQYDHAANLWSQVSTNMPPVTLFYPGMVYDQKNHKFVLFGGQHQGVNSTNTWTYDSMTSGPWVQQNPIIIGSTTTLPALVNPFMAYDTRAGVTLMTGGILQSTGTYNNQVWIYDAGANTWTRLADLPPGAPNTDQGQFITYDTDDDVFLLRSFSTVSNLWGFRYAAGPVDRNPPAKPQGLVLE